MDGVFGDVGREFVAAAGAEELPFFREVVHAVERFEENLLMLHEVVGVMRMERVVLRRIEVEEFCERLPLPDVAELEVVFLAINLFERHRAQLAERVMDAVPLAADDAARLDDEPLARHEAHSCLFRATMTACEHDVPVSAENRHVGNLDLAAALTVECDAAEGIHEHDHPLLSAGVLPNGRP